MSFDLKKYLAVAKRWEQSEQPFAAAAACLIEQLCDEVARLRMTDAEREALEESTIEAMDESANFNAVLAGRGEERLWPELAGRLRERAATLRAFLKRHPKRGET